jgi:hypothetical protein
MPGWLWFSLHSRSSLASFSLLDRFEHSMNMWLMAQSYYANRQHCYKEQSFMCRTWDRYAPFVPLIYRCLQAFTQVWVEMQFVRSESPKSTVFHGVFRQLCLSSDVSNLGFHPTLEKPKFMGDSRVIPSSNEHFLFADVRRSSPEIAGFAIKAVKPTDLIYATCIFMMQTVVIANLL